MSQTRVPMKPQAAISILYAAMVILIPAGIAVGTVEGGVRWLIAGVAALVAGLWAFGVIRRAAFVSIDGIRLRRVRSATAVEWGRVTSISIEPRCYRTYVSMRHRTATGLTTERLGLVDLAALGRIIDHAEERSTQIELSDTRTYPCYRARMTRHLVAARLGRIDPATPTPRRTRAERVWFVVSVLLFCSLVAGRFVLAAIRAEPNRQPPSFDLDLSRDLAVLSGGSSFEATQSWARRFDDHPVDATIDCSAPIDVPERFASPVFVRVVGPTGAWEVAPLATEAIEVESPWSIAELVGRPGIESAGASGVIGRATEVWVFDEDGPIRFGCR